MIRISKEGCLISSYDKEDHVDVYVHSFWEGMVDNHPVSRQK